MEEDKQHDKLVADLTKLAEEAKANNFHDFKSKEYPAPKMTLSNKLRMLRNDVLRGKYDNK